MAEFKSGQKVIMEGESVPFWLQGMAGYIINVYSAKASVRVPVDDDRIHRVRLADMVPTRRYL